MARRPEGITDLGGDVAGAVPDDEGREPQHQVPVQLDAVLPVHVVPPLGGVLVPGGKWQTVITRPVSPARTASWSFQSRPAQLPEPPASQVTSSLLASG